LPTPLQQFLRRKAGNYLGGTSATRYERCLRFRQPNCLSKVSFRQIKKRFHHPASIFLLHTLMHSNSTCGEIKVNCSNKCIPTAFFSGDSSLAIYNHTLLSTNTLSLIGLVPVKFVIRKISGELTEKLASFLDSYFSIFFCHIDTLRLRKQSLHHLGSLLLQSGRCLLPLLSRGTLDFQYDTFHN